MLTLETIKPGMSATLDIRLTREDLEAFTRVSGDDAPLHIDVDYAKQNGFSGEVVHGALLGAFVSRFVGTVLPGPCSLLQRLDLKFRSPCYIDTDLTLRGHVKRVSPAVRAVSLQIDICRGDEVIAEARTVHVIMDPPEAPEPAGD